MSLIRDEAKHKTIRLKNANAQTQDSIRIGIIYLANIVCHPIDISKCADMRRAVSGERKAPESLDVNGGSGGR
jgi:hypothetical protein